LISYDVKDGYQGLEPWSDFGSYLCCLMAEIATLSSHFWCCLAVPG